MSPLFLLILFSAVQSRGQSSITFDTQYWFAAPYTTQAYWPGTAFRISAFDSPATVTISIPLNGGFTPKTVVVPANSTQTVTLTNTEIGQVINTTGNGNMPTGILIETDAKISVYYEPGGGSQSPDLIALKGSEALGTEFIVPMQQESSVRADAEGQQGFVVVATEDNTSVTITPKAEITGRPAGAPFTINLNRGETYFGQTPGIAPGLSGTTVNSDKPVTVTIFSELMRYGATAADLGSEQLVPVSSLGTTYLVVKGYRSATDIVYFTAVEDATTISVDGTQVATLNATDTYELQTGGTAAFYVETSKPVTALQLSGVAGEQSFSLLPPLSSCNGSNVVSVVRANNGEFYVNIVSPVTSGFLVNGDAGLLAAPAFTSAGTSGWHYARIEVPPALVGAGNPVIVSNTDPGVKFQMGVFHTNNGGARYGYFSSYSGITINFNQAAAQLCEGESVTFTPSVLSTEPVVSYSWTGPGGFTSSEASLILQNVTLAQAGDYILEVTTASCTSQATVTLDVEERPDAPVSGGNQYVCAEDPVQTLTATATAAAGSTITWYDAPTGGNVVPDPSLASVGSVTYYAEANNGSCSSSNRTPVSLVIEAGPDINPLADQVACGAYELPPITGTALSGNEAYFTGPGGTGTRYEPGDLITAAGANQLYIYDKAASVANCAGSLTVTGNTTLPPDHPLYIQTHPPYPGTVDAAFWEGTANQLIQHGASSYEQVYHMIAGDVSLGNTADCFGTEVKIEASVTITNLGPGNALGYPGRLAIANKTTGEYLYLASLPVNFPANASASPVVSGVVPLADLLAGNIVILIALETSQLNIVKNWELSNFEASYTFIPENTVGCADEEPFTVTIGAALPAPISGGDQEETATGQTLTATAALPATAPAGSTIVWYDAPTGGNVVADPSLSTNGSVTYYAEIQAGDCRGPRTAVKLTLTPLLPEVCGNGIDDDGNGVADCDDPACNPYANYFANGSMERYTQCPNYSSLGTLEYVVSWKTSQPASTGDTGGQLMVNDPAAGCVSPRPAGSWTASTDLPAGSDGVAWGGMHGGAVNQPREDFQNTLVAPLPAGTYTFTFSAGYLMQSPYTGAGRFRFYGVQPGEADFTTAHPLGYSPMITNEISASNPAWKEYSFTFTSTETYDRIYIVAYSGPTARSFMVFDGFSMSYNAPEIDFQSQLATCVGSAILEVTNPDAAWASYQWYLDGAPISGATGTTYQPAAGQSGMYTVRAVMAGDCLTAASPGIEVSADCPVPFVCNGSAYLVSTPGGGVPSTLSIVAANNPKNVFATLAPSIPGGYNAIGYNFEDNLIYGFVSSPDDPEIVNEIVQIDGEGTVRRLGRPTSTQVGRGMETWTTDPSVNPNGARINGAPGVVGLDNKFYAMVQANGSGMHLATVDLTSMTYTTIPLNGDYLSADLAFSPFDGMLYGLAGANQLIRTNPATGDQQVVPPASGSVPAAGAGGAWNDVQGRVYFYANGGTPAQGGQRLYRYNPANGAFVNVTDVTSFPGFDATACFPTSLEKTVLKPAGGINPGDVVQVQFSIYNNQMLPMTYDFEDILTSSDLSWVADAVVPASPGGGIVTLSGQTLSISDITVPPSAANGPLTFTVSIKVADNATYESCYTNQATITQGGMTILSDDPTTVTEDDPTEFCLNPCTVLLTIGQLTCDPADGTYSVSYVSNGDVTATAGTVDAANNMITGIPLGTGITVTSSCSGSSVTAQVAGLATCPDDCVMPDLTLGQPLCGTGNTYTVSYSESTGAAIMVTGGTDNGDGTITGTIGTAITVMASNGNCTSTLTVTSPVGCDVPCKNPSISIGGTQCASDGSATYEVVFTVLPDAVVTSDQGTVDIANGIITGIPLGTPATLTVSYQNCPDLVIVVPSSKCTRDFSASKTVTDASGDSQAQAGEELTYTISIANTGDVNLTGLTVNDVIPAGTNYVDNSADNGGIFNAAGNALDWTVNVPVGTTLDLTFKVTVDENLTGIAEIANKATVTDPENPDNPEEPESPPVPTDPQRDFDSEKSVTDASGDDKAQAGEELTYTISIENTGDIDLTGMTISDPIPAGTSYLDGSADNGGVYTAATGSLDWTVDIPYGETLIITFKVTVGDNLTGVTEIANKATVTDPEDPGNPEEPESPPVPTDPVRDFDSQKSVTDASGDGKAQAGEELTYTISIENTGDIELTGMTISDPIPAGTSYLDGSADNGGVYTAATGSLDWTVDIPYGETLNITFKVTVGDNLTGVIEIANKATVTDPEDPGNPEEPESPPVPTDPVRDFDSQKSVTDASGDGKAQAGEELTYTIAIENTGDTELTGMTISDPIPAGTSYLDGSADNGGVYTAATGSLDWTVDIPYGETLNITFKVTVNENLTGIAEIANKAKVTDPENPDKPEEPETPPVPVEEVRDFDSQKSVTDASGDGKAQASEELTYTISITNTGNVNLTGMTISDPIPAGTSYLDGSATHEGIYDTENGRLDWTVDIPYGETLNITFKVTVNDNLTGISGIANKARVTDPENPDKPEEPETPPVPVDRVRDFETSKTVADAGGDGNARAGEEMTYTITVENTGNVDLTGFIITDAVPENTEYVEGSADNDGTFENNGLSWTVAIPFGESKSVSFKVTVAGNLTGIDQIANTATVKDPENPDDPKEPSSPDVPVFIPDPIANDDEGEVETGDEVIITIMDNDETDGSPLDPASVEIIDEPLHGTLTVNPDGTITYTPDPDFAGEDAFTYRVQDEDGNWSNVAIVDITVKARPLSIPNLFTPNGDGRNDTFVIPGLEGFPDNELFIVNRWGNEVFRQVNYKNTWTGEGLNEGTYYYILRIRDAAGKEEVYKGYITLVRTFAR
ncbi:DUF7507 domain-containing protein [Anseongella ginsenosidimutans]|nr:gliding motility-associated C-terminal domain-containing protein [Anseongella ginsenosidimutans]